MVKAHERSKNNGENTQQYNGGWVSQGQDLTFVQADTGIIRGDEETTAVRGVELNASDLAALGLLASPILHICMAFCWHQSPLLL